MTRHVQPSELKAHLPGSPVASAVLMTREVSEHRWHFATAMRSIGSLLRAAGKLPAGPSRAPGYLDFTETDGRDALALAVRRASWISRADTSVILVSPGPLLTQILDLVAAADIFVVVIAGDEDMIEDSCCIALSCTFVRDGDDLVSVPSTPWWPRPESANA